MAQRGKAEMKALKAAGLSKGHYLIRHEDLSTIQFGLLKEVFGGIWIGFAIILAGFLTESQHVLFLGLSLTVFLVIRGLWIFRKLRRLMQRIRQHSSEKFRNEVEPDYVDLPTAMQRAKEQKVDWLQLREGEQI